MGNANFAMLLFRGNGHNSNADFGVGNAELDSKSSF
jgi:hypothetical protein